MGKINTIVDDMKKGLIKHSPEILIGMGITGMLTTTVLAVKATPKAIRIIEEHDTPLTKVDTVKKTWKCYVPAAIVGGASIACILGGAKTNLRRNAALAAAYSLSEATVRDFDFYKSKVVEEIGEKKEQKIREKVASKRLEDRKPSNAEIIITGNGDVDCFDAVSGRLFKSDVETLRRAENTINRRLIHEMSVTLNEFYDEIGLDHTTIGDDIGWNIDRGQLELTFDSALTSENKPYLVVTYKCAPMYHFA